MSSTLWSGRFDSEPNAAVFDFGASFRFDRRLFEDDVIGSLAWARALAAAGVLSEAEASATIAALRDILAKGQSDPAWVAGADEDVHSFVERQLVERIGDTGRRLHTGRSRNEQVSLDLRLFLRRRAASIQVAIRRLIAAFVALAEQCGDARMPAYTHLRRAQPVLIAHFLLAQGHLVDRMGYFAHVPREGLSQVLLPIFANQHQHETARAHLLPNVCLRIGIGIHDDHHVTVQKRARISGDVVHLLDKPWIVGAVSKDQQGPFHPAMLGK